MRKVEYRCYMENDWSGFMDGEFFVDGESAGDVDFVAKQDVLEGDLLSDFAAPGDVFLEPFTENEARKYFADAGYPDVVFVYG